MKSRSKELLDRSIAATVAAIEIYNKPDFQYREEAFAVLATNGWELLLKAKWLALNKNKVRTLYVTEKGTTPKGKRAAIRAPIVIFYASPSAKNLLQADVVVVTPEEQGLFSKDEALQVHGIRHPA